MHRKTPAILAQITALGLGLIALSRGEAGTTPESFPASGSGTMTDAPRAAAIAPAPFNLPLPTLGGRQFWGDLVHCRGWRIQQHVYTRHCRLLDPHDVRLAWGTREQCLAELERLKVECRIPPLSGKAVILIHGIIRSSKAMSRLEEELTDAGYIVVALDYPSTRVPIADAAAYLREVIASLDGVEQIDFVVHSLGGLVVRSYLQQTAEQPDPRLQRLVMLGTPHRGSPLADFAQENLALRALLGPAGGQLVATDNGLLATLPTPRLEFACIAGARGDAQGFNPFIPGDDDGVVAVDSALLPGAADSLQLPVLHSLLPFDERVISAVRRFLETGHLRDHGERVPVPR